jgi:hypothetical protein
MPETEVVMSEDVTFSQFQLGIAYVGKRAARYFHSNL